LTRIFLGTEDSMPSVSDNMPGGWTPAAVSILDLMV